MRILKFGGTSLGSSESITKVLSILQSRINNAEKIIVVVSAFSGITDQLIEVSTSGQSKNRHDILNSIKCRHIDVINALFTQTEKPDILRQFEILFKELISALNENPRNQHELNRTQDYIIGFGERFSAQIITSCLKKYNINALYTDTRNLIKTNEDYGFAKVIKNISYNKISDYNFKNTDSIIVATGFIASTLDGFSTTLGRGGSDYTASIIGAATKADAVEIWTDVDGLMTADPNKVKTAIPISQISYSSAKTMSKFGAKVIYPPTIEPAMKYDIPIYIKNTFKPELAGTLIHNRPIGSADNIFGISNMSNVCLLTIKSKQIKSVSNILAKKLIDSQSGRKLIIISINDNYFAKIAFTEQKTTESLLSADLIIRKELKGLIDQFAITTNLTMITVFGSTAEISSLMNFISDSYDLAVREMIYNKKLSTLSIFTESEYENRLLNVIHNLFTNKEESVDI